MPPIHTVTVDLDDTLWPCRPPLEAAEQALYDWLGRNAARLAQACDMVQLRRHRLALKEARPEIAHDITALRRESLALLFEEHGYASDLVDQAMALFLEYRNRVTPYRDAAPVLGALRRSYRLVSVTNGNADVERTPLCGLIHHALRADQVGAAKPHPAMFRAALRWAETPAPEAALHVGDDPLLDVHAARSFGMRAVWINRDGRAWPADLPPPELEISDLFALQEYLAV